MCVTKTENMEHIFFLGMEMLGQYQDGECRLYFVTEEKLPRVNSLLYKTDDGIMMNERYAASDVKIYLCKPDTLGEDLLEEYLWTNKKNT